MKMWTTNRTPYVFWNAKGRKPKRPDRPGVGVRGPHTRTKRRGGLSGLDDAAVTVAVWCVALAAAGCLLLVLRAAGEAGQ